VSIILLGVLGIFFYLVMSFIEYLFIGHRVKKPE